MVPGAEHVPVRIPVAHGWIEADLLLPPSPHGLIICAHGSGSGRHSPRSEWVAAFLQARGFAALLADLLTTREAALTRGEFDIDSALLGERVVSLVDWVRHQPHLEHLPIGLLGGTTGAAAALLAAAARPRVVAAVVSGGGHPDLAAARLPDVIVPTLLIVAGLDGPGLKSNRRALASMPGVAHLEVVEGASHLFEEPDRLDQVAVMAAEWFAEWLRPHTHASAARAAGAQTAR